MSGEELRDLSFRIADSISTTSAKGKEVGITMLHVSFFLGSCISIYMPMTATSVAIYFGIILAGCAVVSIADSFATPEVKSRLQISKSTMIFTQVLHLFSPIEFL